MKEFLRKRMVALKRKPQTIAMVMLAISFLVYSLRLRLISDTTAKIMKPGMGFCGFVTMLLSILVFVCFLNSFPHRKKVNIPMLVLFFLMQVIIFVCDYTYLGKVNEALIAEGENMVRLLVANPFIIQARSLLQAHMVLIGVTTALVALLPVYTPLLRKIDTSITIEGNENMSSIELTED